ncbi:MAG: outer membrane protein assembly factor BamD [Elusimicrobia bacterium]|nr:outer membrane protein assembly factor BamD [Elusimicrobiota bacterium]
MDRKNSFLPVAIVIVSLGTLCLSGCIATSKEMIDLRDDIAQLQVKLTEVQRNQADLSLKMDTMNGSMGVLTSALQETQNHMSLLSQRLDDVEANISQRVGKLSDQSAPPSVASRMGLEPTPSDLYRMAYSDFSRGKYDVAITGFKSYLEKYSKGELAPQAQYYLGESYYSRSEWQNALDQYECVEKLFPRSEVVSPTRLKKAQCLELLGKKGESGDMFKSIIKDFPGSQEAIIAQEKLHPAKSPAK